MIDFEDNSALSDEECAAQDDKAYNPETAGLALHDSVISETDTRASFITALQKLLRIFENSNDDEDTKAFFQEERVSEDENPGVHLNFLAAWKLFVKEKNRRSPKRIGMTSVHRLVCSAHLF